MRRAVSACQRRARWSGYYSAGAACGIEAKPGRRYRMIHGGAAKDRPKAVSVFSLDLTSRDALSIGNDVAADDVAEQLPFLAFEPHYLQLGHALTGNGCGRQA